MKYTIIVTDDEPHARDYIEDIVNSDDSLELIGKCKNGNEVIKFCKNLVPDIILLDVQMPGIDGIQVARELSRIDNPPIIVFTTAYDQYAIKAFEVFAFGFLLKPFSEDQFNKTLMRAKSQCDQRKRLDFSEKIEQLYQKINRDSSNKLEHIEIKEKGLIKKVVLKNVEYITADSEYVKFYTKDGIHIYRTSLRLLTTQLPDNFLRIHRSYIINTNYVDNWKYLNNSTFEFTFFSGEKLHSSRSYLPQIQEYYSGK